MTAFGSPRVPAITANVSALTTVDVVPTALAGKNRDASAQNTKPRPR